MILGSLVVFTTTALLDLAWARYTIALGLRQAWRASVWSAVITVASGLTFVQVVDNNWLLIPAALGAAVGTYWGTKR